MKLTIPIKTILLPLFISFFVQLRAQQQDKIQIMFVGFDHLNQMDNGTPTSDIFSDKKQAELIKLTNALKKYKPDFIGVEDDPKLQDFEDSLYTAYLKGNVDFKAYKTGARESYQVGYRLGKLLGLDHIHAVDNDNSTSQSLLKSGDHFDLFMDGLKKLQTTARPLKQSVQNDSMSIYDYIKYINKPEIIDLTHHLFYNLPAYVMNGEFSDGINTVDIGEIDNKYIGAEYITLFYNRNLKIYSNILNTQLKTDKKRLLIMFGQAHIGVLQDLFEENPNYEIISPLNYLK
ncbi:DUF5694 domain-containing protein [Fulvivirga sediminis]|uniref:Uncharacterized protein n=1 Tax=Fulvivirga sediminis TaxID=2803949 RepID=A0A937K2P2_9BACT|nr:DUF5694 domain-containing protein [Fulvivirga sediminis]MBL3658032.1 hypothetical protein [Fulvivirga sediminis]